MLWNDEKSQGLFVFGYGDFRTNQLHFRKHFCRLSSTNLVSGSIRNSCPIFFADRQEEVLRFFKGEGAVGWAWQEGGQCHAVAKSDSMLLVERRSRGWSNFSSFLGLVLDDESFSLIQYFELNGHKIHIAKIYEIKTKTAQIMQCTDCGEFYRCSAL